MSITHHVNQKETYMSSVKNERSEPTAGGKGIYIALIPWIVFTVLVAHSWVARYARGIAALILSLISFASLLFTPFTEQYAREQVPEQYWSSPRFKEINRKQTLLWACVFAAMVPFHAIAGTLDTQAGNVVLNWVVPLALVTWAVKRSSAAGESDTGSVQKVA